tara:strand:+ start:205 stop:471 length:267 start_codon:yes stop_codon:yes gene_type:complete
MANTYIVHGTQYFEKEVQLQINAPNMEQAEIRAYEITKGRGTRTGMGSCSFSMDFMEQVNKESIVAYTDPVLEEKLRKRLDEFTNMET